MPCSLCGDIVPDEVARCPACGCRTGRRDFRVIGGGLFLLLGLNAVLALASGMNLNRISGSLRKATHDTYDPAAASQELRPYTDIVLVALVLAAITGVVFTVWLWQAHRYAHETAAGYRVTRRQGYGRAWVILGWLCPVLNLWVPPRLIHELWSGDQPAASRRHLRGAVVLAWWITFLSALGLTTAYASSGTETLSEARLTGHLALGAMGMYALSAALCMAIVFHVTRAHDPVLAEPGGTAPA